MNMMDIGVEHLLRNTKNEKNYNLKIKSKFVKIKLKQKAEIYMDGLTPLIQKLVLALHLMK